MCLAAPFRLIRITWWMRLSSTVVIYGKAHPIKVITSAWMHCILEWCVLRLTLSFNLNVMRIKLQWSEVCYNFIRVYFKPESHLKPGSDKQWRGLKSNALTDTFINSIKTHVSKATSLFKCNFNNSSLLLISNNFLFSFVCSICSLRRQMFFNLLNKPFFHNC